MWAGALMSLASGLLHVEALQKRTLDNPRLGAILFCLGFPLLCWSLRGWERLRPPGPTARVVTRDQVDRAPPG
jgi:hypothetical protein